jgi:3-oxoadipate enol-lactonase
MDQLGLERVHFVGLSLGGMVGQWLAVNAPERLKTLTLCATFSKTDPSLWDDRIAAVQRNGVSAIVDATLERWLTEPFRTAHADRMAAVREMILRTTVEGYAGSAAAIRDMDIENYAEKIRVPTLLLAAEDDVSATPAGMRDIHRKIVGSEFVRIADAAHVFTLEKPAQTAKIIGEFLTRHDGA